MLSDKARYALICLWIEQIFLLLGLLFLIAMGVLVTQLHAFSQEPIPAGFWIYIWIVGGFVGLLSIAFMVWHSFVIRGLKERRSGAWLQGCIVFGISILSGSLITGILGLIFLLDPEVKAYYEGSPLPQRPQDDLWPEA
ncbi:hypothetical protein [Deinococcus cellulosilyticus]|nr:hypothetical protein [Deinococcus cellulosilyticus]